MGLEHSGRLPFVSFEHPLAIMAEGAGESGPPSEIGALLKEQNLYRTIQRQKVD